MQDNSNRQRKTLKRMFMALMRTGYNILQSFREVFDLLLSTLGLKRRIPRRRNKDFERAGREVPTIDTADSSSMKNLNAAGRTREKEVIQQVRFERKMLRRRNQQAEELRQTMEEDNRSVSQGDAISHLARMNQRQRSKKKAEDAQKGS